MLIMHLLMYWGNKFLIILVHSLKEQEIMAKILQPLYFLFFQGNQYFRKIIIICINYVLWL